MKTVLITGASSGIGRELACLFARDQYNLILIARRADKLEELKKELITQNRIQVHLLVLDLAKEGAPLEIYEFVKKQQLEITYLINNAGFGDYGYFYKSDWPKTAQMIQLNITTLTRLVHLFLPAMIEKREGWIMNVASTAGFVPGPLMSVYYASKAYVLSFSEALASELKGTGVVISILCPGPTGTEFQMAAGMSRARINKLKVMASAESVARYGYRALHKGKTIVLPGVLNKLTPFFVRLVPRKVITNAIRRISAE